MDGSTRGKLGALEIIKELTPAYAQAKADRTYLEHFRKSKKAILMVEGERDHGIKSGTLQERYAYAHPEYIALLEGLRAAVEQEERLRFQIMAADSAIRVWQTKQASARAEGRVLG